MGQYDLHAEHQLFHQYAIENATRQSLYLLLTTLTPAGVCNKVTPAQPEHMKMTGAACQIKYHQHSVAYQAAVRHLVSP